MTDPEYYQTIEKTALAEYKDRGSKFIAYAYPVQTAEDCRQYLQALKKGTFQSGSSLFCLPAGNRWQYIQGE